MLPCHLEVEFGHHNCCTIDHSKLEKVHEIAIGGNEIMFYFLKIGKKMKKRDEMENITYALILEVGWARNQTCKKHELVGSLCWHDHKKMFHAL